MLHFLVTRLNQVAGMSLQAWEREGDQLRAMPGCYILDASYGGYRLCQIVSLEGDERDITPHYPSSVTADLIRAYMAGITLERDRAKP
jgi:hypothetical protein